MIIIDEPTQKIAKKPARMLLWQKIRGGMVAVFGLRIWIATNPSNRQPASVRRAIMRPLCLFQYVSDLLPRVDLGTWGSSTMGIQDHPTAEPTAGR